MIAGHNKDLEADAVRKNELPRRTPTEPSSSDQALVFLSDSDEPTRFQIIDDFDGGCEDQLAAFETKIDDRMYCSEVLECPEDSFGALHSQDVNLDDRSFSDAASDVHVESTKDARQNRNNIVDLRDYDLARESQKERRRSRREESSDLIWVEYFNSSMQSLGKEAARVENIGAGGMRVAIKSAPPTLDRVIVSYSYRGFESCSLVRDRYQTDDGFERLCLQFVNKEWQANPTGPLRNPLDPVGPRKVLLADDDGAFRKILGNILTRAGYEVVLAEDGETAIQQFVSESPDLVITDGLMPRVHGFQVCKAVKERSPQTKVIMVTAVYRSPNQMREAQSKYGADDILTKPCEIAQLLQKVEKHLAVSNRAIA